MFQVLRAEKGWSGDLMIADYEDLQESEAFVKEEDEFPCANGIQGLPYRPRASLQTEGNLEPEDDDDIEERDKKRRKTEDSCSMR